MPWEVFDPAGTELQPAAPPEHNVSTFRDFFTGENRTEHPDMPEFAGAYENNLPPAAKAAMQYKAIGLKGDTESPENQAAADQYLSGRKAIAQSEITPDPKAQLDILRKAIPGLEARPDKYGNVMVRAPGMKEFAYLNKPGASRRDLSELLTQSAATAPLLAAAGAGSTPLLRAGASALGLGSASVAQDVMAGQAGSEQGVDPTRAVLSATLGAGSAGIAEPLLGGSAKLAGKALAYPASRVRAALNPGAEAERRVMGAAKEDMLHGTMGMTSQEAAAAQAAGQDVRNLDVGGDTLRAEARRAANMAPNARQELTDFVGDRFAGQGDRTADYITQLAARPNGAAPNAFITREQLKAAAQASVGPRYAPAMAKGASGLTSPELDKLATAPAVQQALGSAKTEMQNRIAAGRATGMYGPNGAPTLEYWDLVKRRLGDRIDTLKRTGANSEALDLDSLRVQLTKQLDNMVPEYAAARGTAQGFFKANDALDAGEKFVRGKYDLNEAKAALGKMTPEERDLFAEGFASKFADVMRELPDRRNVLNAIAQSSAARQRLTIALGPNRARNLEGFLRIEGVMDLARQALGNSTTARQLIEAGVFGYGAYNNDPNLMMLAALSHGSKVAGQHIDRRVAEQVVKKLLSQDTGQFLSAVRQVSSTPMLDALRAFDKLVAKTGIGRTLGAKAGAERLTAPAPMVPANPAPNPSPSPAAPPPFGAAPSGPPVAPTPAPGGPPAPAAPGGQSVVQKTSQIDPAEAYQLAIEAIKNGAPRDAVKQRLADYGVDPEGLA